jgi:RsmE family RNA methyltransferase
LNSAENYYFIFGPEGGLSEKELNLFDANEIYNLTPYRLRTETAIVKCASMINEFI